MTRPAIGRGLNALFQKTGPEVGGGVRELSVTVLVANPDQPRIDFDDARLEELTESIRSNGVIQPLIARPVGEKFQVVAGERRLRAARSAGLTQVPVVVRQDIDDADALVLGLIENLQREDLNVVEEARCLDRLVAESGVTHDELAKRLGKSRAHITNTLRLLKLPDEVLGWLRKGRLSAGHARALLTLDLPEQMVDVAASVIEEGWSVRRLEEFLKTYARARDARRKKVGGRPAAERYPSAAKELAEYLAAKVSIRHRQGKKGKLTIEFDSKEQLADILARIGDIEV